MEITDKKRRLIALLFGLICFVVFASLFIGNWDGLFADSFSNRNSDFHSDDFVKFIDVGQGDSTLICSDGYSAIIDAGISDTASDICAELDDSGVDTLDVMVLTHLDNDHIGGAKRVIEIYKPKNLILPEISVESEGLATAHLVIGKVTDYGGNIYTATAGMNFEIGDFKATVLAHFSEQDKENNRSIVMMAEIDKIKFLFTGDIEKKAEAELLNEGLNLKCDVLKVAHHGSNSSSGDDFLEASKPKYAVISVGKDNIYKMPNSKVLSNLQYYGANIYRTDINGDIVFYVNDGEITVKTFK